VEPLFRQILDVAEREGLDVSTRTPGPEALRRCLLVGFCDRLARRADEGTLRCELVHGRAGLLARESVVRSSPLLVAAEIREVENRGGLATLLSLASAVEPAWIAELFPGEAVRKAEVRWDPAARRAVAEEVERFRGLALSSRRVEPAPAEESARLLAAEVLAGRLLLHGWDDAVQQWIHRVNFLAKFCPELGIPAFGEEDRRAVLEQSCHGASSYKEIKDRPMLPAVRDWLGAAQRALVEKHAPERIELPGGRQPKVVYAGDAPPHFGTRLQDLYGVTQTPRIAMGRVPLVVHLLAPNQRPVQVTQDLAGFWTEHYPRVKKELQRRYPRHEWR
jgi:ATP-dependent helicase HrpB